MKAAVAMYAKYPKAGKTKTRLAKGIGHKKALTVYKNLLHSLVKQHKNTTYAFYVSYYPEEKLQDFKQLLGHDLFILQEGPTLTERLLNTFKKLLTTHEKVVITSSDTPDVDEVSANQALELLETHDLVLGPAYDGGYYLIAMKAPHNVFQNMDWSTEKVLQQTVKNAQALNLTVALLEQKRDIDTIEDLQALPLDRQKFLLTDER